MLENLHLQMNSPKIKMTPTSKTTVPDYARPADFTGFTPDGHRGLDRHLPKARHHHVPPWLNRRCRAFDIVSRQPIDCGGGYLIKPSHKPARYLSQEFSHFMNSRGLWYSLFDHWGSLELPDGRIALHSSPYNTDGYKAAQALAQALGLELLSSPGDLSHYGYGTRWFLWAESATPAKP
jgi:hypothetical protein